MVVQGVPVHRTGGAPQKGGDEGGEVADDPLIKLQVPGHLVVVLLREGGEGQHADRVAGQGDPLQDLQGGGTVPVETAPDAGGHIARIEDGHLVLLQYL